MIVAFADETFITFGVEHGYDGDVGIFQHELNLEDFGREALVYSGIITQGELQWKMEEIGKARLQGREAAERRQYARLKKKFEKGE